MVVQNIQIIFDKPTAVFSPGQSVTGRIFIMNSCHVTIKSIQLKFRGEAKISWTEKKSRKKSDGKTEFYSEELYAEEVYFENNITAVGGEGELQLEDGECLYPFNVFLPRNLPSTFNGDHGHVRYTAIVTVVFPWWENKEREITFKVINSSLNLNDEPLLAEPKMDEIEKTYCSCFCMSGPMTLVAWIPYSGFVPGQIIPLTIGLDNNSDVEIEAVQINLIRCITFISAYPRRETNSRTTEFKMLRLQGVKDHASKTWTESILVPNNFMLPNLNHCKFITVHYELKVEAIAGIMNTNTSVNMEIKMGIIPLTIAKGAPQYSIPVQSLYENHS